MEEEVLEHYVQRGDTFWGLAEAYYGDGSKYPYIQQYNNKTSLYAGDVIYIPPLSHFQQPAVRHVNNNRQQQHHQPVQQQRDVNSQRMQIMLNALGYDTRGIDGIIGRNTQAAVQRFQQDYGLYASGDGDQDTINTMYSAFMNNPIYATGLVLQALVHNAGYNPGKLDGVVGRNTRAAIANFQRDYGLYASGEADDDTIIALKNALYNNGC